MADTAAEQQGIEGLPETPQSATDIAPQSAPVAEEFVRAMAAESKAELVLVEYKEATLHALEGLCPHASQEARLAFT